MTSTQGDQIESTFLSLNEWGRTQFKQCLLGVLGMPSSYFDEDNSSDHVRYIAEHLVINVRCGSLELSNISLKVSKTSEEDVATFVRNCDNCFHKLAVRLTFEIKLRTFFEDASGYHGVYVLKCSEYQLNVIFNFIKNLENLEYSLSAVNVPSTQLDSYIEQCSSYRSTK